MRSFTFTLDSKSLEVFYFSFIRPILEYADVAWDNLTQSEEDDLEKIQLEFLRERDLFGNRKPSSNEWLKHEEMYRAISRKIDPSHICGLQRVGTMWRIYVVRT